MTFRKRRNPTPGFKLPPPYEPLEGIRAPLKTEGVFPYCAMYQVAEEDTEDDYVLCRGFDVRVNKFIDYEKDNPNKPGIPVAKPYGQRGSGCYSVGQIFAAMLPLQTPNASPTAVEWRVGQNPGVAETSTGHPTDLEEKVDELHTEENKAINWMFIQSPGMQVIEITHITHTSPSFDMKNYGVCLGKYVSFDTELEWNETYKKGSGEILSYVPDDDLVEDVEKRYIFIGFVDQSKAGVPGQRYFAMPYGTKTCGELTRPLVMVEGGTPVACVLAEDHPGCGVVFDVWIAPRWDIEMDSSNGDWDLSHSTAIWDIKGCDDETYGVVKFKAIDKRKGVPEPLKYATGLFAPRVSKAYGIILEVIELDCESPGGCYFCEEPVA